MREPLKPDQAVSVGSALHRDSGRLMNALMVAQRDGYLRKAIRFKKQPERERHSRG